MLSAKAIEWFANRAIPREVIERMGIYTGKLVGGEVQPDADGDVIAFPFFDHGKIVNEKYRGKPKPDGSKKIWQKVGGKRTFYNVDALDHPALRGGAPLVVVEGEPDLLAVKASGYEHVVSVPDGAPPAFDQFGDPLPEVPRNARIVVETDDKFAFLRSTWKRLKGVKRVILFVDGDPAGVRLREELARRIGRARSWFVTYPKGCKDANEVLLTYGADAVRLMIDHAVPLPIDVRKVSEIGNSDASPVYSTGWQSLDVRPGGKAHGSVMLPQVGFVTLLGRPGDGKSTWVKQLAVQIAKLHGWHVMLAPFEEPGGYLVRSLRTYYLERPESLWSEDDKRRADEWLDQFFCVLAPRWDFEDDEESDIDWLLEKMQEAIGRYGANVFIIDPWNEIEHRRRRDETLSEYTGRAIRSLKRFAAINDALVIVIVHPTKDGGLEGEQMSLYDADGSAHWANKPDIGLIVFRDESSNRMTLRIRKLRFSRLGERGDVHFTFDPNLEAFY
jgi:twinkle protein